MAYPSSHHAGVPAGRTKQPRTHHLNLILARTGKFFRCSKAMSIVALEQRRSIVGSFELTNEW